MRESFNLIDHPGLKQNLMKQVAEALKQLQVNGEWDQEMIAKIGTEIADNSLARIFPSQIKEVFEAIISIYGNKTPNIKWNERSGKHPWETGKRYIWEHDVTGERFVDSFPLSETYPHFAGKWADGEFGGNTFESCGVEFKTNTTIRGFGYKAVLAFDLSGNGIVFC